MRSLIASVLLFLLMCCSGAKETPKELEERSVVNELPQQNEKYRPPDGGFGTLDASRDVREEAEQQQQASRDALQDAQ